MISVGARVKLPKITIKNPDKRFWAGVGLTEVSEIHKRTLKGSDANEKRFRPYSKAYAETRREKGRTSHVNLTFTGRMLKSMGRGIRSSKNRVRLSLSGGEGFKAFKLERGGREFFSISSKREEAIKKRVLAWMVKKNGLK